MDNPKFEIRSTSGRTFPSRKLGRPKGPRNKQKLENFKATVVNGKVNDKVDDKAEDNFKKQIQTVNK